MSSFRFLDLPDELRLKMYRFILPRGERIHLDPDNVQFPIPYIVEESYGTTFDFVQVCKKIYVESMQFIYKHNMVNIIETISGGNFLQDLGIAACQYLTKLECHVVEGLMDLGNIWDTLKECPRLTDIRLVFYHEPRNWSRTLAQLVNYKQTHESEDCLHQIDVELHTSIWARHQLGYARLFQMNVGMARTHAKVYNYEIPPQFRHVTITASVNRVAAQELLQWEGHSVDGWRFRSASLNDTDTKKTLRCIKNQPST